MKTHETFLQLGAAALDFPLSPDDRRRLDDHVARCPACRRSVDGMRTDAAAFGELPVPRLGDRRADEMLAFILRPSVGVRHPMRLVAIAALLALLLLGSLVVGAEVMRRLEDDHLAVLPSVPVPTLAPNVSPGPVATPGPSETVDIQTSGRLAVTRGDEGGAWVEGHTWVEIVTLETGASSGLGFGADPAWGPDGLLVYACAKELGENTTLCTLDADQPGETQPEIASDATRPAPAPDGSRIAFHRGAIDVGETWLVEADGSNLRRLAAGSFLEWSPDGAWLAGQPESAAYQVAIVRADGTGLTVLAPGYGPAWSPSGARIAYSLVEDETASIRVVDVASGEVAIRYSAPAGVELSGPAWLADGALVFVQAGDLWRLPADTDVPTRITTDLGLDPSGDPLSVSPDGRWTAFTRGSGADARVGIASVDGTVRTLDLGAGSVSQPAWGPPPAGQASAQIGHSWASGVAPVVVDRPLGRIEAATAGGPGFVAVGRGCQAVTGTERCEGIVWTSADGRTWVRAPASDATDIGAVFPTSGPEVGMFDVAAGSPGVVAIGYAARPDIQPTAWFSADGFTWRRIPLGAANSYRVHAVAWSGERFVIVGEDRTAGPTSASEIRTTPARAAVWTSTDGIAWARVPHTAAFDIGGYIDTMEDPASGGISDVAAWSGGLVAVGSVCEAASMTCQPAVWTSPDGTSWARMADVPAVPGLLKAVAASGSSLVAVGAETCGSSPVALPGGCPPLVLTSVDGRSWTQASWPFTQSGDLRTVTRIGDAFFATAPDGPATLWTSADGATWAPAELAGGPATAGAGLFAEWHFAVSGDVAVWLGTPTTAGDPAAWLSVSAP